MLQTLFFIGIAAQLYFAKSSFTELSQNLYGHDAPLMNSYIMDFFANKFIAIIFLVISSIALYKVIIINNLKSKFLLNIVGNIVHALIGSMIIYVLYSQ